MIATKDRAEPLRLTLSEMRKQDYPLMDLLVIDDGSECPVEPLVREIWPDATVIRHHSAAGQCSRRNEGFAVATGEFILQLDDDCSFPDSASLSLAVQQLRSTPDAGAICFYMINSADLPEKIDLTHLRSGCVASFVGAAVLFRKIALNQTAGYRSSFRGQWEEEELGLQLLSRGWPIIFLPKVLAHHRLSNLNRNSAASWSRGIRNSIWGLLIHVPFPRVIFEIAWKITLGAWDAIRLMRLSLFLQALFQTTTDLPRVLSLRTPLSPTALRRYDALRFRPVLTPGEFEDPPVLTRAALFDYLKRWRNRARNRSVWNQANTDVGKSYTVAYAHEHADSQSSTTEN
jgi:GT2 family glycosyltransferase